MSDGPGSASASDGKEPDREFGPHGWVLVAAIVVAFLVAPGMLYVLPFVREEALALGLPWRDAYLTIPLVPALVLAAVAVWSAVRARRG